MDANHRPPTRQVLLAFSIIYFVWGSTFLAIRIGVSEVPPFLLAAMRFLLGELLCTRGCAPRAQLHQPDVSGPQRRCWRC